MNEPVSLIGVYRSRNAAYVRRLVEPSLAHGWAIAWWALDEVVDELAPWTVGSGGGARLVLLNEILRRRPAEGWLVVSDDDVVFAQGDVVGLVSLCDRARLDLAQPARSDSGADHEITVGRRLSRARRTSFVEVGPLFVVGRRWRDCIVPFPEERGMGWGLELEWFALHRQGCRLGIVDQVRIRHEGTRGEAYDVEREISRIHEELVSRGFDGWHSVQQTFETWRPWQRHPRWVR